MLYTILPYLLLCVPDYLYDITQGKLEITGDGEITQDFIRTSGPYQTYISIVINNGPTSIAISAFEECNDVQTITISSTISQIGCPFMRRCYNLREIIVNNNQNFENDQYGILYSKGRLALYRVPPKSTNFQIASEVTTIKEQAMQAAVFESVTIPANVVTIEKGIFYDSTINNLNFADGAKVQYFWDYAFSICCLGKVTLPPSIKELSIGLFSESYAKTIEFQTPSNLQVIKNNCFLKTMITQIQIPENTLAIQANAFSQCSNLQTIYLPSTLTTFDISAITLCPNLNMINIPISNKNFISEGGILKDASGSSIYFVPIELNTINISSSVKDIGKTVLQSCSNMQSITMDQNEWLHSDGTVLYRYISKQPLNYNAIAIVGGATSANIIEGTTSIDEFCSAGLKKLTTLTLPSTLSSINSNAFDGCVMLQAVSFPSSLQTISGNAFNGCKGLQTVTFPETGTIHIYSSAFQDCVNIQNIDFRCAVTHVDYYAFGKCGARSIIFRKDELQELGNIAFEGMENLEYVELPSSLKIIPLECFASCHNLQHVYFPRGCFINEAQTRCFWNCTSLKNFSFPTTIKSIASGVFLDCTSLVEVYFLDDAQITSLDFSSVFEGCSSLVKVVIPNTVKEITVSLFRKCFNLTHINISLRNEVLESRDGLVYNKNENLLLICPPGRQSADISTVTKGIRSQCFYGCEMLQSLTFMNPSKLTAIEELTFFQCKNLKLIELPGNVASIAGSAFQECSSLQRVTFASQSNLKTIGAGSFLSCSTLEYIQFDRCPNLQSISDNCFKECIRLGSITIPKRVSSIGVSSFAGCVQLNKVSIQVDAELESIGASAFYGCRLLSSFVFPHKLRSIGTSCFVESGFSGHAVLPASVQSVGDNAFVSTSILTITYCGNSDLSGVSAFNYHISAFAPYYYKQETMLGLSVDRRLNESCQLMTPLLTPLDANRFLVAMLPIMDSAEGG